uniref:Uncharacterized protein n=1 Tax=Oncorhynchus mykiss TaxID=8022 RepID=A0A8C7PFN5_ONCMY
MPQVSNPSIHTCRIVEQNVLHFSFQTDLFPKECEPRGKTSYSGTWIVIKPADKGGVVIHTIRQKIITSLMNISIGNSELTLHRTKITNYLTFAVDQNWISKHEFDYLHCKILVIPVFYMLPKIHKSLFKPKGRPKIASIDSLLEPLSNFVDSFIKPIVPETLTSPRSSNGLGILLKFSVWIGTEQD